MLFHSNSIFETVILYNCRINGFRYILLHLYITTLRLEYINQLLTIIKLTSTEANAAGVATNGAIAAILDKSIFMDILFAFTNDLAAPVLATNADAVAKRASSTITVFILLVYVVVFTSVLTHMIDLN